MCSEPARRVIVIGGPGAGKSTLARAIGAAYGLPVIHLDRLYWQPGWVARSRAEMADLVRAEIAQDAWVLDGNYAETFPERSARADMIVHLDLPTTLRLWRVIWRWYWYRGSVRPDLPPDCPEHIDLDFLGYVVGYRRRRRPKALALIAAAPAGTRCHHLRSSRAVEAFLATLPRGNGEATVAT